MRRRDQIGADQAGIRSSLGPWPLVAISVVGLAAILTIAYVLFQWWSAYHFYSLFAADVKDKLDSYKVQADDLQRLVSLLVAFSSLYALVLGVSSYMSAQGLLDQSKENAKRIESLRSDLEVSFPFFRRMGDRMKGIKDHLDKLMPDSDERDDYYERLSTADMQKLEAVEQSAVTWLYFLDFTEAADTASDIYRHLGKYYSARYNRQKIGLAKQVEAAALLPAINLERNIDLKQRRRDVESLADRAHFFLSNAIQTNPDNFLAYNDLAYLLQDIEGTGSSAAENFYLTSIRHEPKQQRAYYNLALIEHSRGRYKEAEELSTRALSYENWQIRPNAERKDDVRYNRACYRSRLGERFPKEGRKWADGAEMDLRESCRKNNLERLSLLNDDCAPGKDLAWFNSMRPSVVIGLKRILAG